MTLKIRFLGNIEIENSGTRVMLPPSRKTRALLAYLVMTGRPHRRERLCFLFWDVPDDPRGALRWSLSKLRGLVDEPNTRRIVADRNSVGFDLTDTHVDLIELRNKLANGAADASTRSLEAAVTAFRGDFLEGLELSNCLDFQSWCVSEREDCRRLRIDVLQALVSRHRQSPEAALPYARSLVEADPLNESARASLVRLLAECGRRSEAEQHYEAGSRLLREIGADDGGLLEKSWRSIREHAGGSRVRENPVRQASEGASPPCSATSAEPDNKRLPLIGRQSEWSGLTSALAAATTRLREHVVLVTGDPGIGKSRLMEELAAYARRQGATVLEGRAFEAESDRPYGPWIDALRSLPAAVMGPKISADLAPLLPELAQEVDEQHTRDRLFGAVADLVGGRAKSAPPLLLTFDDVQWCDQSSATLLHYVVRMCRQRPVFVVLAARAGELPDNLAMLGVLRGLRRDRLLTEIQLGPLNREEINQLLQGATGTRNSAQVFSECGGNPLFALELARSLPHRTGDVPRTLAQLVRDRIERLPVSAADVLRWAAVLGNNFAVKGLRELTPLRLEELIPALETLERHALLREARSSDEPGAAYEFAHDIIRNVVYTEISEPRRRLMHWQIARSLRDSKARDDTAAADIAHHAALAGEAGIAAGACAAAGRRCLRVFANTEAETLARRGIRHADELPEPERTKVTLELQEISWAARRPSEPDQTASMIEELAERALDHGCIEHARLGFHLLSLLRWEGGDWSDAERHTLHAEFVSRSAGEREHIVAMAEAARCLTLLERDLAQAEALVLEAKALSKRTGFEHAAIFDAKGMLHMHQGKLEEAAECFRRARALSRRDRDHVGEFQALEHLVMLELQREDCLEAQSLTEELTVIGDKLREGSEAPFAATLSALSRYAVAGDGSAEDLAEAIQLLRVVDAKHRLAYALTRAADIDLRRKKPDLARMRAEEALGVSRLLGRPSEIALALVVLARAASDLVDEEIANTHWKELSRLSMDGISRYARQAVESYLQEHSLAVTDHADR